MTPGDRQCSSFEYGAPKRVANPAQGKIIETSGTGADELCIDGLQGVLTIGNLARLAGSGQPGTDVTMSVGKSWRREGLADTRNATQETEVNTCTARLTRRRDETGHRPGGQPQPGTKATDEGEHTMRVLLSTYGTRGDVEPLVALSVRLRALGAEVRMCAPPDEEFARRLAGLGVQLVPVGPPVKELMRGATLPSAADLARYRDEMVARQFEIFPAAAD